MSRTINWGIIGCGGIANTFARSIAKVEDTTILAGASRTEGKAAAFAQRHGVPVSYDNYEDLVKRADIHAVYVATTHNFHYENVKLALENGKSVLCEKPFTVNAKEARELISLARTKKLFLMEAMWTRFLPAICQVRDWLNEGLLGDIRQIRAHFGFNAGFNPGGRLFNKALAGGALLDAGIYPVSFASMVAKKQPESIVATAHIGETDVDYQSHVLFNYGANCVASLGCTCTTRIPNRAEIYGTKGKILIPSSFLAAQEAELSVVEDNSTLTKRLPYPSGAGFMFEIQEAVNCMRMGKLESDIITLDETLAIMETMDTIRGTIGLVYDND